MPEEVGKKAVANAFPYDISLRTVRRLYRELDWMPEDIALDLEKYYRLAIPPPSQGRALSSGPTLPS